MATTPAEPGSDPPAARWIGRARVGPTASSSSSARPASVRYARVAPAGTDRGGRSGSGGGSGGGSGRRPPPPIAPPRRTGPKPRWGRIALVGAMALALIAAIGVVAALVWVHGVDSSLKRNDPFSQIAGGRPQKLADGSLNVLMLGSDSRDPGAPVDRAGDQRTDTIMILHIPASHDKAYVVTLPRDLWVHIPESADGQHGNTMAKINAAYAWGGEPLMVQTVEEYTGVRMDHVVLIDFSGFVKVTDALGGVEMNVEQTITSIHPPNRVFTQGMHTFNGTEALDYVRQRYQFSDGDFARQRHQQEFLKALLDKAASAGTLSNPIRFKDFVSSAAAAITVDKDFSLMDLGWQFRNLRSSNLSFLISPNLGAGTEGNESVVLSDRAKAGGLYDAMAKDTLSSYLGG